jgi:hypothetical protein
MMLGDNEMVPVCGRNFVCFYLFRQAELCLVALIHLIAMSNLGASLDQIAAVQHLEIILWLH